MTTTNDSLKLAELLKTPICKMDGEELAFLISSITSNQQPHTQPVSDVQGHCPLTSSINFAFLATRPVKFE